MDLSPYSDPSPPMHWHRFCLPLLYHIRPINPLLCDGELALCKSSVTYSHRTVASADTNKTRQLVLRETAFVYKAYKKYIPYSWFDTGGEQRFLLQKHV